MDTVATPLARPPVPASIGTFRREFGAAAEQASMAPGQAGAALTQRTDDVAVLLLVELAPGSRLWGWSRVRATEFTIGH